MYVARCTQWRAPRIDASMAGDFAQPAYEKVTGRLNYAAKKNGLGEPLPNFCLKVPTGGGKTLLATQVLGLIYSAILEKRNGAGLVLWVVPSDQIYKDTLKALRDRNHFYRFSLEHAVSRRGPTPADQGIAHRWRQTSC